ncbi:phage baseplate protein [Clostridium akagii]|uniref:phage baseplate protein n=1 Tax=Clostridium akagii TaxID=91623 RepID=UPI00047D11C0|nr:hypothetical protein [Clostridium akagii]
MFDGFYPLNLEVNKALADLPDVKTTDHKSRGLDITRTLNGVVQNTANQAIYLNAKTPNGRTIFEVADVIDTGVGHYMVTYPDSMVNVAGAVSLELMIVDPTGTISTNTGTVNVVQAVSNYEDIISDPNYPALLKALNTIQAMQASLVDMQTQINNAEHYETGDIVASPVAKNIAHWLPLDGRSTSGYSGLASIYGANLPNVDGKTLVQIDATQTEFNAISKTGGEKTHTLSIAESAAHIHGLDMYKCSEENAGHYSLLPQGYNGYNGFADRVMVVASNGARSTEYIESTGGGQAHNNLQPYIVIGKFYVHI